MRSQHCKFSGVKTRQITSKLQVWLHTTQHEVWGSHQLVSVNISVLFNDIHGQIQPTDILIMCSAYKWIAATITTTYHHHGKVISTFLVMGRAWNTVFLVED